MMWVKARKKTGIGFQGTEIFRKPHRLRILGAGLFLTVLLASCDATADFFSTSWGSGLARDQEQLLPKISAKNAWELARDTAGDPAKARLVAEKILEALSHTSDPAEKDALLNAGLNATNNASNLVPVILGNVDSFLDPSMSVQAALEKIQAVGDVQKDAAIISGLLDAGGKSGLGAVSQDNLVLAAVTLLLADAQEQGISDPGSQEQYLKKFEQNRKNNGSLTDRQIKALDLAGAAAGKNGALNDILALLKLK
jgi:hypothetical protein